MAACCESCTRPITHAVLIHTIRINTPDLENKKDQICRLCGSCMEAMKKLFEILRREFSTAYAVQMSVGMVKGDGAVRWYQTFA